MMARTRQRGMALIEVMVAVVILAVGVLGAVGLQAKALSALANAGARADAAIAAEKLVGLMWTDQANLASYVWDSTGGTTAPAGVASWMTETQALLPNATAAITVTPIAGSTANQVGITITWKRRSGDNVNTHAIVAILAPTS